QRAKPKPCGDEELRVAVRTLQNPDSDLSETVESTEVKPDDNSAPAEASVAPVVLPAGTDAAKPQVANRELKKQQPRDIEVQADVTPQPAQGSEIRTPSESPESRHPARTTGAGETFTTHAAATERQIG